MKLGILVALFCLVLVAGCEGSDGAPPEVPLVQSPATTEPSEEETKPPEQPQQPEPEPAATNHPPRATCASLAAGAPAGTIENGHTPSRRRYVRPREGTT